MRLLTSVRGDLTTTLVIGVLIVGLITPMATVSATLGPIPHNQMEAAGEWVDQQLVTSPTAQNRSGDTKTVTVIDVVDGDTVDIRYQNGSTDTVRLLGIDTPETHTETDPSEFEGIPNTEAGRSHLRGWGENISTFVEGLINGTTVTIKFDPQTDRRGSFDRLLAYVTVNDSYTLNYQLVANGYARVFKSGFSKESRYLDAEATARSADRGLWNFTAATNPDPVSELVVARIHEDAQGNEFDNLNDEYIVFKNTGNTTLDLGGWTVADAANHDYSVPTNTTLAPGGQLTLRTGSGIDNDTNLYWESDAPIWNNGGDTITVKTATGQIVLQQEYPIDSGSGAELTPIVGNNTPTDPNDDGIYEDITGDGQANILDVGAFLENRRSKTVQNNIDAFDFTGDRAVNILDVGKLLQHVL